MNEPIVLGLFEGYGIEIEYMIVDRDTLAIAPIADELLRAAGGSYESEIERGEIAWSNELVLHLMEMKTNGPKPQVDGLAPLFQRQIREANQLLEGLGARLMPTAMHPWMNPKLETRLWPHEYGEVYRAYDRIFGCHDHGWANVQSIHVNLPFANDAEFARLHAAIRIVLPILPGLAASSPIVDGAISERLDTRLYYYARHAARVPSVSGYVIPEPIFSIDEYRRHLLPRIFADVSALDQDGVLSNEWLNARGCIARFDRMAIEIRLLDTQECPAADIAIATAASRVVQWLVEEVWCSTKQQRTWDHRELAATLELCSTSADLAVIDNRRLLDCFGYPDRGSATARDLWQHLIEVTMRNEPVTDESSAALQHISANGTLARRIRDSFEPEPTRQQLRSIYSDLADCLAAGRLFEAKR